MGLRDQILNGTPKELRPVTVPGWPAGLFVRLITGAEAAGVTDFTQATKDSREHIAYLVAMCLCDDKGKRIFDPDSRKDREALAQKEFRALKIISDAAVEHNGLGDEAVEAAKND